MRKFIMSQVEHDFWTDEAKTSSTGAMKLLVDSARKNLLPNKDRLVFVTDGKGGRERRQRYFDARAHARTYGLSPVIGWAEFRLHGGLCHPPHDFPPTSQLGT
jgi:hypothetical protein